MNSVNEFWAIDFDRCIGNAKAAIGLLERVAGELVPGIDVTAMESARVQLESAGGSFDMLHYIQNAVQDREMYQGVLAAYLAEAAAMGEESLLQPGTHELFDYLDSRKLLYGIVSYGHVTWQGLKIKAAGLDAVPRLIVSHSRKGEIIATWRTDEGLFQVPSELSRGTPLVSQSVILVDDKAVSFSGLPDGARGYWVRSGELLVSQQGDVPSSVTPVESLYGVVNEETVRLSALTK